MKWIMNKRDEVTSTIFTLASTDIKIHKIVGVPNNLYLTYALLDIHQHSLNTDDFGEAKKRAVEYIQRVRRMLLDKTEVDKNMLVQAAIEPDEFSKW